MLTKSSSKFLFRLVSGAVIFSLILAFTPGLITGPRRAAAEGEPPVTGVPETPFQTQLADAINQRIALGLPAPSVTFSNQAGALESFSLMADPLKAPAVDQPTTKTAMTTLFFDGPEEAGYTVWPAVVASGTVGGEENAFTSDDYTEFIRGIVEAERARIIEEMAQTPNAEQTVPEEFGQEAREIVITETIEVSPGKDPLNGDLSTLSALGAAPGSGLLLDEPSDSTTEDILMGFTYTGPHLNYIKELQVRSCFWFFGRRCIEWFYFRGGFELDWAMGLRLPATVDLHKGSTNLAFDTSLTPQDWSADQYAAAGVAAEDGNEFVMRLDFWAGVLIRVLGGEVCPPGMICYLDLSSNGSQSFTTPFGLGTSFPIPAINIDVFSVNLAGISVDVFLSITPQLTSTLITAAWTANKGAACNDSGILQYTQPDVAVSFNPDEECFSLGSDPVEVRVDSFRYFFNKFGIAFGAGIGFDVYGLYSATWTIDLFTLDLSKITKVANLSVGDHVECNYLFVCRRAGPDNVLLLSASLDKTPPIITYEITGPAGKDNWYSGDVALTWTVTDAESALLSTTGCVPEAITVDGPQALFTCSATSSGGTASLDVIIGVDTSAPVITCPLEDPFVLNSGDHTVGPAEVADSLSGWDAQAANVLYGTLSASAVGLQTLTFTAFDIAGNSDSKDCNYAVYYKSSGFLPPVLEVNDDNDVVELNVGKAGRTYPIKWQLADYFDAYMSDLLMVTSIKYLPSDACGYSDAATVLLEEMSAVSSWRYDSVDNQFIYNWKTPAAPGCYALDVTLDSGQVMTAIFDLK